MLPKSSVTVGHARSEECARAGAAWVAAAHLIESLAYRRFGNKRPQPVFALAHDLSA